jgi:hypothetical protein
MTRKAYSPEMLDELALRMLDLAVIVRQMAHSSRENQIPDLTLHDKKALEYCEKLERWTQRAQADLEICVHRQRAVRRAQLLGDGTG